MKIETLRKGQVAIYLFDYHSFVEADFFPLILPQEKEFLSNIQHPKKRLEYAATRGLRTKIFGDLPIEYSPIGSPKLANREFISISHSHQLVGIAHSKDFPIGLDIEFIRPKVLRVKDKFLSEEEKINTETTSAEEMSKIWSGKEALYKLAGRKKIIFAQHLHLRKIDTDFWEGKIQFDNQAKMVNLDIHRKGDYIISVNPTPVYEVQ